MRVVFLPLLATVFAVCFSTLTCAADTIHDSRIGAYRLTDDSVVAIGPSDDDRLRWLRLDGTMGLLHKAANNA